MAQVILQGISMFCNFGGAYIAPLYVPIISLVNFGAIPICLLFWSILLLSIFTPIMVSPPNVLNSDDNANINGGRAFGFSFLIYYVVTVLILCSIMQLTCKVSNTYNPM